MLVHYWLQTLVQTLFQTLVQTLFQRLFQRLVQRWFKGCFMPNCNVKCWISTQLPIKRWLLIERWFLMLIDATKRWFLMLGAELMPHVFKLNYEVGFSTMVSSYQMLVQIKVCETLESMLIK